MLLELVYSSIAVPGGIPAAELSAILERARRYNAQHQLTGVLITHSEAFVQLLEGPPDEVRRLYDRIVRDPRHRSVQVCWEQAIDRRSFPQWSMGFACPRDAPAGGFADLDLQLKTDWSGDKETQSVGRRVLTTLYAQLRASASESTGASQR